MHSPGLLATRRMGVSLRALSLIALVSRHSVEAQCPEPGCEIPMMCTGMYDPQCGCDGEQYSNECQATCVNPTPNPGGGECPDPEPAPEPEEECGLTYNECSACDCTIDYYDAVQGIGSCSSFMPVGGSAEDVTAYCDAYFGPGTGYQGYCDLTCGYCQDSCVATPPPPVH